MPDQPPNPYAPTDALSHETAKADERTPRKPSRVAAVVVAIFSGPLAGGFLLLGLRRRFFAWSAAIVAVLVTTIATVWVPLPKLFLIMIAVMLVVTVTSYVATGLATPGAAPPKRRALTIVLLLAGSIGVNVVVRVWFVESYKIPSGSMAPTLIVGDHIMVKKGHGEVQRGDIIVFKQPGDRASDYIKRVMAVGGDTIEVRDGVPSIDGVPLEHAAIDAPCSDSEISFSGAEEATPCTLVRETNAGHAYTIMLSPDRPAVDHPRTVVPPNTVFVMGDNRDNSYDSRRFGTVPLDLIKGRPKLTWWSTDPKTGVRPSRIGRGIE